MQRNDLDANASNAHTAFDKNFHEFERDLGQRFQAYMDIHPDTKNIFPTAYEVARKLQTGESISSYQMHVASLQAGILGFTDAFRMAFLATVMTQVNQKDAPALVRSTQEQQRLFLQEFNRAKQKISSLKQPPSTVASGAC